MREKLFWLGFIFLFIAFFVYYLNFVSIKPDGDIVEYFGITESLINHQSLNLTQIDIDKLLLVIDAPKFSNPGYYIKGIDGARYPVHFFAYSILLIPMRLILESVGKNPLLTFPLTNLILLFLALMVIFRVYLNKLSNRLFGLALVLFSPLVFFISWPGPDLFYCLLLLLSLFALNQKQYFLASFFSALASWQSQPLLILSLFFILLYFLKQKKVVWSIYLIIVLAIPYLYNLLVFGVFSPWLVFQDNWTKLYGFGMQNLSLLKTWEQFFDLNIGLFWYSSLILGLFVFGALKAVRKNQVFLWLILAFFLTSFFYQTNPAWNYGTAGYGPTRHVLFLIPLLIFFIIQEISFKTVKKYLVYLLILALIQGYSLIFNGFLAPDTTKTLYHSPYAEYVLNKYPQLYNPTPEIFMDRTLHTDVTKPTSAIYKNKQGLCRKVYLLKEDLNKVINECGFIPHSYENQLKELAGFNQFKGLYVNY